MEQMKSLKGELSLRKSLALYIVLFTILAIILCVLTVTISNYAMAAIWAKYPHTGQKYYLTNEQGEQLGEGAYISTESREVSKRDERLVEILEILPIVLAPVYSALCILAAVFLFYRNKLEKPLAELMTASENIVHNDLDFKMQYRAEDEMGQLCTAFETMRTTLADNLSKMWRQMEERGRLNAAFAHDLRTPLTVLKGYQELLLANDNNDVKGTAVTMGKHISRMEHYVNSMNQLQRLEDMQPEGRLVVLENMISSLYESAEILCKQNGKNLQWTSQNEKRQFELDVDFVIQVSNNLISNAVQYAETNIVMSFEGKEEGLLLSVADDGIGFTEDGLRKAAEPYFTEEKHAEHFGLGLYICKILCEHHGGYLQVDNTMEGAKVTAFFENLS